MYVWLEDGGMQIHPPHIPLVHLYLPLLLYV